MDRILWLLRLWNYIFGTIVLLAGFMGFVIFRSPIPLLLALALTAVRPVEDLLNKRPHLANVDLVRTKELVNQSTSLTFVVPLLVAILIAL